MNIATYIKSNKVIVISALAIAFVFIFADSASAATLADEARKGVNAVGDPDSSKSFGEVIVQVVNFMLYAIGILAVIMVIVGGIRFVLSAGDSNATTGARNTILYAIIGLVIAFVAWGLVNFVSGIFTPPPPTP